MTDPAESDLKRMGIERGVLDFRAEDGLTARISGIDRTFLFRNARLSRSGAPCPCLHFANAGCTGERGLSTCTY